MVYSKNPSISLLKESPKKELSLKTSQGESTSKCTPGTFISYLFSCRTVAHILHLKTLDFAAHKALDEFYSQLVDIADSIAEAYQGYSTTFITGYVDYPVAKYENYDPMKYMLEAREYIRNERYEAFPKDYSPIQNELDNLENLFNTTIYKLKLK